MTHLYRSAYPLTQQSFYTQNQVNKFVLSTAGEAIVPGSVRINGLCAVSTTVVNDAGGNLTPPAAGTEIYIDPDTGYHALFMKMETGTRVHGTIESNTYYPRMVKTKAMGKSYSTGMAVDSLNSIEGRNKSYLLTSGMLQGVGNAADPVNGYVPFSVVADIWLNKMDGPLAGSKCGNEVYIQFTMSTNQQFLSGAGVTGTCQYVVTNLKVDWEAVPEASVDLTKPISFEKYLDDRFVMNSTITSINASVAGGLCDAVHMSFVPQNTEFSLNSNFLQCAPPPGNPLYVPPGGAQNTLPDYGINRLIWSINNNDTTLSGFVQDTREEIFWNALRSLNLEPSAYRTDWEDPYLPDAYFAGIPFGGLIDLLAKRFSAQLYSNCQSTYPYICYTFFRSTGQIN